MLVVSSLGIVLRYSSFLYCSFSSFGCCSGGSGFPYGSSCIPSMSISTFSFSSILSSCAYVCLSIVLPLGLVFLVRMRCVVFLLVLVLFGVVRVLCLLMCR